MKPRNADRHEPVIILGAGALGIMYASALYDAGYQVAFVAEGERADRLKNGVTVNGRLVVIDVVLPDSAAALNPRLLIVALKHHDLPKLIGTVPQLCTPDTTVISVMNGIESEERLIEVLGEERVLYCIARAMDAVRVGNSLSFSTMGQTLIGRAINKSESSDTRVESVRQILTSAGIDVLVPSNMVRELWDKFMINVGVNQVSAVLGATYGVFHRYEPARDLMHAAMSEVLAIARIRHIALDDDDLFRWDAVIGRLGADGKTSMLQDIEAHRPTEVDAFAGRVTAMGKESGIPTPVNDFLYKAIRVRELMAGAVF